MRLICLITFQSLLSVTSPSAVEQKTHPPKLETQHEQVGNDDDNTPLEVQKPNGDESCPCLSFDDLYDNEQDPAILVALPEHVNSILGPLVNKTNYGVGCAPHDALSSVCSNSDNRCSRIVPVPADCDNSWCGRSWCFVDASNCGVVHKPSVYFEGRHFSYATCGHIDSFTLAERRKAVEGKTYRVAFNDNTGGWKGAYNPDGNFAINNKWHGPIVDFVETAALVGKFTVNITRPPDWLYEKSKRFFGLSFFDYCIYATSLGYLDFCVAAYTLTDKRVASATFFETTTNPLYLISFADSGGTSWSVFAKELSTVFRPFTWEVWLLIILFILPGLGILMLVHEYNAPGSAFPRNVPVLATTKQQESEEKRDEIREKYVPRIQHIGTSVYMGILTFLQNSYGHSVVTVGGKINLLAISSFVLMVSAVYTANLAAILTQNIQRTAVNNLDDVIKRGYRICMSRKDAVLLTNLHGIDPSNIVPDPVDMGGDGQPGFDCPKCEARKRVFDFMKQDNTNPSLYCDVAITTVEDLELFQGFGDHCNKTRVGDVLAHRNFGIPIYSGVSKELISLFHDMKNNGLMLKSANEAFPDSTCPEEEGEGTALTMEQMTGIWIITFVFALMGIITLLFKKKFCPRGPEKERQLQRHDQWGHPTSHCISFNGKKFDPGDYENNTSLQPQPILSPVGINENCVRYDFSSSIPNVQGRRRSDTSVIVGKELGEDWYEEYKKQTQRFPNIHRRRSIDLVHDEAQLNAQSP